MNLFARSLIIFMAIGLALAGKANPVRKVIPDHRDLKGRRGHQDHPGLPVNQGLPTNQGLPVKQGLRVNPVLRVKQDRRDRHP